MYLILHKISKTGTSILDISLVEVYMNNIRAVHTELHSEANNRNWLIWTSALLHQISSTALRSQSVCGEDWWVHISIREGVLPEFRRKPLHSFSAWSPYYEFLS